LVDSKISNSDFWNRIGTSKYAVIVTRDNVDSLASGYQTIATGEQGTGNIEFDKVQFHDFIATGTTSGAAIRLRGCGSMKFRGPQIDSSSTVGAVLIEKVGTTNVSFLMMESLTIYTEGNTAPGFGFSIASGATLLAPSFPGSNQFTVGTAHFGGAGIINGGGAGDLSLDFRVTPGSAVTNSTVYMGHAGHSSAEFSASYYVQRRGIVCNLNGGFDGTISAGQHAITVQKNGSDTSLTNTVASGSTISDATHWALWAGGDRFCAKNIASATATGVQASGACALIPY
jgi:hypothetical protein